jgi:hypothetical protein
MTGVQQAIVDADATLPGPDENSFGPQWQVLIVIAEFVEAHPLEVWGVIDRWGNSTIEDLRDAIATLLLEHLLEFHFEQYIDRVESRALADRMFADTVRRCHKFGRSELPENSHRLDRLMEAICSK